MMNSKMYSTQKETTFKAIDDLAQKPFSEDNLETDERPGDAGSPTTEDDASNSALVPCKDGIAASKAFPKQRASASPLANPALVSAVAGAILASLVLVIRRQSRRRRATSYASAYFRKIHVQYRCDNHRDSTSSKPSLQPDDRRLSGISFVVSERFDLADEATSFGCRPWRESQLPCPQSARIVVSMQSEGSICMGVGTTRPFACEPCPSRVRSLQHDFGWRDSGGTWQIHGGGEYGTAVSLAMCQADLGIVVDEMASAMLPAACCGMYAYRPTFDMVSTDGVALLSPTLATTAFMARNGTDILRAVKALPDFPKGPGGGDVVNYLVAEDLFELCDGALQSVTPAVIRAVRRWAGSDQAQAVSICEWMYHRFPRLRKCIKESPGFQQERENGTDAASSKSMVDNVLEALLLVATKIHKTEASRSRYFTWAKKVLVLETDQLQNGKAARELPEAIRMAVLDNESQNGNSSDPFKLSSSQMGTTLSYKEAREVADEISKGMRAALSEGYVFVIPTAPGPAPLLPYDGKKRETTSAGKAAVLEHRRRALQFSLLSALGGVPQVAIPLVVPDSPPLSISLVALQRRDLMLLQAAVKIGPMLEEEISKLYLQTNALRKKKKQEKPSTSKQKASNASESDVDAAEMLKEAGNEAFKAGRYEEAIRRYTEAMHLNPNNAVYPSNRAMAQLKLGNYSAAETDCDAALSIDNYLVKGWLRRASARMAMGMLEDARSDFKRVVELEPRNRQALDELARLQGSTMLK